MAVHKKSQANNKPKPLSLRIESPKTDALLEHNLMKGNDNAQETHRLLEHHLIKGDQHDKKTELQSDNLLEATGKTHQKMEEGANKIASSIDALKPSMDAAGFIASFMKAIRGDQGEKGETGEKGDKGEIGQTGEKGYQGEKGDNGQDSTVMGPKGDKGDRGDDGYDAEVDYPKIWDYIREEIAKIPPRNDGKDGDDGASVTVEDVIKAMKNGPKELRFKYDDLDGAPQFPRLAGTGYLREISDVDTTGLQDGMTLVYNAKKNKWTVQTPSSGGGVTPKVYDLSSLLDGTTKSFTIPANTAIVSVTGSNAPFTFRPTIDYTGSGTTTLTFTASVDAPSALQNGASLVIIYY